MQESFTVEQKQYLDGFMSGVRQRMEIPFLGKSATGQFTGNPANAVEEMVYGTPIEDLCKEERIKHEKNGLDIWDRIVRDSELNQFPEQADVFRYKFYGLFHVKPAQDSFMLRCRIPGCALKSYQLRGLAEISKRYGHGYLDITTRGNIQIREIQPKDTISVLVELDEIGLTSKGSGADNVRNVTASPTSGFDPHEVLDVLPYARAMHHYILNHRDLYGLPRKFNISFDNGGAISVCADTNDIGFYAVRLKDSELNSSDVYFRVQLCGITGHKQFATDCGLLIRPSEAIPLAAAMIRVFIENGDRTNRNKARLKYLIDDWGHEKFLAEVEKKLEFSLRRESLDRCVTRNPVDQHGHIGIHPSKQSGIHYLGVKVPVGRLEVEKAHSLARIADTHGNGEIRLTVWQNLILPGIRKECVEAACHEILETNLDYRTDYTSGGLVACTGNKGCKFAATDTKGHAVELGNYLKEQIQLDQPINIHFTGCPHSCAQHYIGDIGLLGAKVKVGEETVEGYHIVLGGGVDNKQAIARELIKSVPFEEVKMIVLRILKDYQESRFEGESFWDYVNRHSIEALSEKILGAESLVSR